MSRYIDAELIDFSRLNNDFDRARAKIIIMGQPTADVVEVRHGEWINNHCTVCGMTPIGEEAWTRLGLTPPKFELCMSFCPCCGAKMDGERRTE